MPAWKDIDFTALTPGQRMKKLREARGWTTVDDFAREFFRFLRDYSEFCLPFLEFVREQPGARGKKDITLLTQALTRYENGEIAVEKLPIFDLLAEILSEFYECLPEFFKTGEDVPDEHGE